MGFHKRWVCGPLMNLAHRAAGHLATTCATAAGRELLLYIHKGQAFCSDVNSTAYQFPLVDAKLSDGPNGPQAECPFDGTLYDLTTGKVLEWCPKNNPLRAVLGWLKSSETPKPLPVFDAQLTDDGEVYIKLAQ
jgi:nitrite reductase/ring-hydroxylating ferredoxin subunit